MRGPDSIPVNDGRMRLDAILKPMPITGRTGSGGRDAVSETKKVSSPANNCLDRIDGPTKKEIRGKTKHVTASANQKTRLGGK